MDLEDITNIFYNTCRAYCANVINLEEREWAKLFNYEKEDILDEIKLFIKDPNRNLGLFHLKWIKKMILNGWTYGKYFDMAAKKHNLLVPFEKLPIEYKFRNYLFKSTVNIITNILNIEINEENDRFNNE